MDELAADPVIQRDRQILPRLDWRQTEIADLRPGRPHPDLRGAFGRVELEGRGRELIGENMIARYPALHCF